MSQSSPVLGRPPGRPASFDAPARATRQSGLPSHLHLGLLGLLLAVAALFRLWRIDYPDANNYDEGVRLEQLYLMSEGFRPFRDLVADQGPLSMDFFYPFFALFGGGVAAGRAPVVFSSFVCLLAIYGAAKQLAGPRAGLAALGLLGLSPLFLSVSRLALSELTSLAPAVLALLLALVYRQSGRSWALYGSGALYGAALMLKPMAAPALLPISAALWFGRERWLSDLLRWGLVAGAICGLVVVVYGPGPLYDEFVRYRQGAAGLGPAGRAQWSLGVNFQQLGRSLSDDLPLVGLGLAGLLLLARLAPLAAVLGGSWLVGSLAMLMLYSPLQGKHGAYLLPALALLAGCGLAGLRRPPRWRLSLALAGRALVGLGLGWYLLALPATLAAAWKQADVPVRTLGPDSDLIPTLELIAATTEPGDYLLTDSPYAAFLARRRVPPRLVDPSRTRIAARALTDEAAIAEVERYRPVAALYWMNRLNQLRGLVAWLERDYQIVQLFDENRAIFVRRDVLSRLPDNENRQVGHELVTYDNRRLALTAFAQRTDDGGRNYELHLTWRALVPLEPEPYLLTFDLRDAAGRLAHRRSLTLGPSWLTRPLPAGPSLPQRKWLDLPNLPPGEYSLQLTLHRGRNGPLVPPAVTPAARFQLVDSGSAVHLGWLAVE